MLDLKVINSVIEQMEQERGIPKAKMLEAIEMALATAYKKEYGKKGQIIKSKLDINSGKAEFVQVKMVVDKDAVVMREEKKDEKKEKEDKRRKGFDKDDGEKIEINEETGEKIIYYNPEHHIFLEDAKKIKRDAKIGDELIFPLEEKSDYGRIAAQTAKQVIIQKIREAEKVSVFNEYGEKEGQIVTGTVQRAERGNIFVDMGRATAILPFEEQIPGEKYIPGERIRGYLYRVEETPKGIFLRLSRSHPKFLEELFKTETPELGAGTVEIKAIAREAGSRSKIAVASKDEHIDPVGSLVGQRGVRVSTVMSELGGEKIDIIEWSDDAKKFIEDALSPARVLSVSINEAEKKTTVEVAADQQSLAIGKGGQNVRLAAKLTGWKIDIVAVEGEYVEAEETKEEK
ncbi:MAG: transcription termination factor NusA [Candidatus Paceibacterota bacterium]|jgi:N utilization substance protein A